MKLTNYLSLAMLVTSVILFSCSEDEVAVDPTAGLIKVAEGVATEAGTKVELWSTEELFVGYNPVFVALYDVKTEKRVVDAHVTLGPLMTMMDMTHSCPVENPESEEAVKMLFPGSLTFIMGSGSMGTWKVTIHVHNHETDKEGSVDLDVTVNVPAVSRLKSFVAETGEKYFVAYNFPVQPKVGVNDISVHMYRLETMTSFPPVTDFSMSLEPEMPSMGHGSPNNVNPVHAGNGHYAGKVNFTMTGDWRLNLKLTQGELVQNTFFDVTLD